MPLVNSMTCAGSLIGFNSGGIKALSRSLNIQVSFTETTLFTPRRCFERAAKKCYDNSLSSIVASCSWDKHVAIGTGLQFDSLWDQKEIGFDFSSTSIRLSTSISYQVGLDLVLYLLSLDYQLLLLGKQY